MVAYRHTVRDVVVSSKPCTLHAVNLVYSGSAEARVRIYDGTDPKSGSLVVTLDCPSKASTMVDMHNLHCPRGIYVDIVERVEEVTVIYTVLPESK